MILAFTVLGGRVIFLGLERIIVKKLGTGADGVSTAFIVLGLSAIFLSFLAISPDMQFYPGLWLSPVSGLLYSIAYILYSRSLSTGEVSLVSPLFNFNLLFLILLTYFFLDEPVTLLKIVGILLMVYGISFLNRQRNILLSLRAVLYDHACRMMITSSLLIAFGRVIDGYSMRDIPPVLYGFSVDVASTTYLFLFLIAQKKLPNAVMQFRKKPVLSLTAGTISACSYLCLLYVFTKMQVSIVEPASTLSVIVTVILAKIVLKENIRARMTGAVIMLAGTWLLFA